MPAAGYWYFIHGGAGAIMSRGLMQLSSFDKCRDFLFGPMPRMSGGTYAFPTAVDVDVEGGQISFFVHIAVCCLVLYCCKHEQVEKRLTKGWTAAAVRQTVCRNVIADTDSISLLLCMELYCDTALTTCGSSTSRMFKFHNNW